MNIIKTPLFYINEEVVVQDKAYPELKGKVYVVVDCQLVSSVDINGDREQTYRYAISTGNLLGELPKWWSEKSLRKWHKPAILSFEELLRRLKNGTLLGRQ